MESFLINRDILSPSIISSCDSGIFIPESQLSGYLDDTNDSKISTQQYYTEDEELIMQNTIPRKKNKLAIANQSFQIAMAKNTNLEILSKTPVNNLKVIHSYRVYGSISKIIAINNQNKKLNTSINKNNEFDQLQEGRIIPQNELDSLDSLCLLIDNSKIIIIHWESIEFRILQMLLVNDNIPSKANIPFQMDYNPSINSLLFCDISNCKVSFIFSKNQLQPEMLSMNNDQTKSKENKIINNNEEKLLCMTCVMDSVEEYLLENTQIRNIIKLGFSFSTSNIGYNLRKMYKNYTLKFDFFTLLIIFKSNKNPSKSESSLNHENYNQNTTNNANLKTSNINSSTTEEKTSFERTILSIVNFKLPDYYDNNNNNKNNINSSNNNNYNEGKEAVGSRKENKKTSKEDVNSPVTEKDQLTMKPKTTNNTRKTQLSNDDCIKIIEEIELPVNDIIDFIYFPYKAYYIIFSKQSILIYYKPEQFMNIIPLSNFDIITNGFLNDLYLKNNLLNASNLQKGIPSKTSICSIFSKYTINLEIKNSNRNVSLHGGSFMLLTDQFVCFLLIVTSNGRIMKLTLDENNKFNFDIEEFHLNYNYRKPRELNEFHKKAFTIIITNPNSIDNVIEGSNNNMNNMINNEIISSNLERTELGLGYDIFLPVDFNNFFLGGKNVDGLLSRLDLEINDFFIEDSLINLTPLVSFSRNPYQSRFFMFSGYDKSGCMNFFHEKFFFQTHVSSPIDNSLGDCLLLREISDHILLALFRNNTFQVFMKGNKFNLLYNEDLSAQLTSITSENFNEKSILEIMNLEFKNTHNSNSNTIENHNYSNNLNSDSQSFQAIIVLFFNNSIGVIEVKNINECQLLFKINTIDLLATTKEINSCFVKTQKHNDAFLVVNSVIVVYLRFQRELLVNTGVVIKENDKSTLEKVKSEGINNCNNEYKLISFDLTSFVNPSNQRIFKVSFNINPDETKRTYLFSALLGSEFHGDLTKLCIYDFSSFIINFDEIIAKSKVFSLQSSKEISKNTTLKIVILSREKREFLGEEETLSGEEVKNSKEVVFSWLINIRLLFVNHLVTEFPCILTSDIEFFERINMQNKRMNININNNNNNNNDENTDNKTKLFDDQTLDLLNFYGNLNNLTAYCTDFSITSSNTFPSQTENKLINKDTKSLYDFNSIYSNIKAELEYTHDKLKTLFFSKTSSIQGIIPECFSLDFIEGKCLLSFISIEKKQFVIYELMVTREENIKDYLIDNYQRVLDIRSLLTHSPKSNNNEVAKECLPNQRLVFKQIHTELISKRQLIFYYTSSQSNVYQTFEDINGKQGIFINIPSQQKFVFVEKGEVVVLEVNKHSLGVFSPCVLFNSNAQVIENLQTNYPNNNESEINNNSQVAEITERFCGFVFYHKGNFIVNTIPSNYEIFKKGLLRRNFIHRFPVLCRQYIIKEGTKDQIELYVTVEKILKEEYLENGGKVINFTYVLVVRKSDDPAIIDEVIFKDSEVISECKIIELTDDKNFKYQIIAVGVNTLYSQDSNQFKNKESTINSSNNLFKPETNSNLINSNSSNNTSKSSSVKLSSAIYFYNMARNKLDLFFNSNNTPLRLTGVITMIQTMEANVILIGEGSKLALFKYSISSRELKQIYSLELKYFPVSFVKEYNLILIADIMQSISLVLFDSKNSCLIAKGCDLNNYLSSACSFLTDYSSCEGLNTSELQSKANNPNSSVTNLTQTNNNRLLNSSSLNNSRFTYNYFFNQIPQSLNNMNNNQTLNTLNSKFQQAKSGFLLSDFEDNVHVFMANIESESVLNLFFEVANIHLGKRIVEFNYHDSLKDEYFYAASDGSIGVLKLINKDLFKKLRKICEYLNNFFPWTGGIMPSDFYEVDCSLKGRRKSLNNQSKNCEFENMIDFSPIEKFLSICFQYQFEFSDSVLGENREFTISSILECLINKHLSK